jgi:hypothetical protein
VSPDALEAAIPASLVGTVARELEELAPDERQAIDAASVGVRRVLALAGGQHAANMDELALEPVLEMLARRRTFIVRRRWNWPTASSVPFIVSRTGSTRRSSSITCRPQSVPAAHGAPARDGARVHRTRTRGAA